MQLLKLLDIMVCTSMNNFHNYLNSFKIIIDLLSEMW